MKESKRSTQRQEIQRHQAPAVRPSTTGGSLSYTEIAPRYGSYSNNKLVVPNTANLEIEKDGK